MRQNTFGRGLTFSLIGAAPQARTFAQGLAGAGHELLGISLLAADDEDTVSALIPQAKFLEPAELIPVSNLILFGVEEKNLAHQISVYADEVGFLNGQLVMHFSANYGTDIFLPAVEQGAIPFALHPAFEFTGTSLDLTRMQEAWCAITAPVAMLPIAQALVIELGAQPFVIDEEDRARYAEAIATARDFSFALVNQTKAILKSVGVEHPGAVLEPVFRSAVEQALNEVVRDTAEMFGVETDLFGNNGPDTAYDNDTDDDL